MGTTLTGKRVQNTYDSLLKLADNENLTGVAKIVGDGLGNDSPIYLSTSQIGIGTTPSYKFDLLGNFRMRISSASGYILTDSGDHRISIYDWENNEVIIFKDLDGSSANQLVVASTGVGINVSNPSEKLHVVGDALITGDSHADAFKPALSTEPIKFKNFASSELARFTNTGRLGIGTTTPETLLHVAGDITVDDNDKIQLGDASDFQLYHNATNNFIDAVTGDLYLRFNTVAALGKQLHIKYTGNSDALVIKSTAQLELSQYGSGTFTGTATYRLAVDTSGNVIEIPIGSGAVDGSGAANKIAIWSDADTLTSDTNLHWDSTNDRLGVGLSNPSYSIHIPDGASNINTDHAIAIGNDADIKLYRHSNTGVNVIEGDGHLNIRTNTITFQNQAGTETLFKAVADAGFEAYYNHSKQFETINQGVEIKVKSIIPSAGNTNGGYWLYGTHAHGFVSNGNGDLRILALTPGGQKEVLRSYIGTASRLVIDGNNYYNVGIGTSSPSSKLDVKSSGSNIDEISLTHSGNTVKIASLGQESGHGSLVLRNNSGAIQTRLSAGGNSSYILNSNVGIGTTSPSKQLMLYGDTPFIRLEDNQGGNKRLDFWVDSNAVAHIDANQSASQITLRTASTDRLRITNAGNIGIGTTSPNRQLHVIGQFAIDNSTSPTAGILISPDSNSNKIYSRIANNSSTPNHLDFISGSSTSMRIDTNGRVGIGTTSPGNKLHVDGGEIQVVNGSYGKLLLQNSTNYVYGDQNGVAIFNANNNLRLYTVGSERMRIDSSGNVGIGTNSPSYNLVVGDGTTDTESRFYHNDASYTSIRGYGLFMSRVNSYIRPTADGTQNLFIGKDNATWNNIELDVNVFTIKKDGSSILNITSGGNVGVGTTSPTIKLDVNSAGSDSVGRFQSTDLRARILIQDSADISYFGTINGITFLGSNDTSGGNNLNILNTGEVGIGTNAPGRLLHLYKSTGTTAIKIEAGDTSQASVDLQNTDSWFRIITNGGALRFWDQSNNTERIRINSSGNLGIGTTSPQQKLHVSGTIRTSGTNDLDIYSDSTAGTFDLNSSTRGFLFKNNNGNLIKIENDGQIKLNEYGSGTFTGTATQRLAVDSSGNIIEVPIGSGAVDGSGAANKLAIWSDADTLTSDTNLHWDTTNNRLGINTDSPSVQLEVHGSNGVKVTQNSGALTAGYFAQMKSDYGEHALRLISRAGDVFRATNYGSAVSILTGTTSSGTSERIRITDAGLVGIGTTSPSVELHVTGGGEVFRIQESSATGSPFMTFFQSGTRRSLIQHLDSGDLLSLVSEYGGIRFMTGTSGTEVERMRIDSSGNVGIGTASPAVKLEVNGGASVSAFFKSSANTVPVSLFTTNNAISTIGFKGLGSTSEYHVRVGANVNDFIAYTNNTEKLRILQNGNVGIGTTSPSAKLDVAGGAEFNGETYIRAQSNVALRVQTIDQGLTSSDGLRVGLNGTHAFVWNYENTPLSFGTNGSQKATILADGKVGIGTTSPSYALDIKNDTSTILNLHRPNSSTAAASFLDFTFNTADASSAIYARIRADVETNTNSGQGGDLSFHTANAGTISEVMRITENGQVGIGTTSPGSALHVAGNIGSTVTGLGVHMGVFNSTHGTIELVGTSGAYIDFTTSGTDHKGRILYDHTSNYLRLDTNGSEKMRITSAGQVGIGTTSPAVKLHVDGFTRINGGLQLDGSNRKILAIDDTSLIFGTNNVEKMRITSAGLVGIGTTSPNVKVEIKGNTNENVQLRLQTDGNASEVPTILFRRNSSAYGEIKYIPDGGGNQGIHITDYRTDASNIIFNTAGSNERMRITSGGNVGIGTTSPVTKLNVVGNVSVSATKAYRMYNAANNAWGEMSFVEADNRIQFNRGIQNSGTDFRLSEDTNASFVCANEGNLGIGTTNPQTKLHVEGITRVTESSNTAFYGGDYVRVFGNQYYSFRNTGGSTIAQIHMNGNSYFNGGNVGIGTTSPSDGDLTINAPKLHVVGPGTGGTYNLAARFQAGNDSDNTGSAILINHSNDRGLLIKAGRKDGDREVAYFDVISSGGNITNMLTMGKFGSDYNVGIGTTSPTYKLDVGGDIGTDRYIRHNDDTNTYFGFSGDDTIQFNTNSNERMRIDSSGNVGIGITSPTAKLHVEGNLELQSNWEIGSNSGSYWQRIRTVDSATATAQAFNFETRNGSGSFITHATILNNGNVGIGTTSPSEKLHVDGVIKNTGFLITESTSVHVGKGQSNSENSIQIGLNRTDNGFAYIDFIGDETYTDYGFRIIRGNTGANTNSQIVHRGTGDLEIKTSDAAPLKFLTASSERMRIDSSGNVGIGTTLPVNPLHVEGNFTLRGNQYMGDDEKLILGLGSDLQIYHNGSDSVIESDTGDLYITNKADGRDLIFRCDDGSGGYTPYFYLAGAGTNVNFQKDAIFVDDVKANFGNAGDLQIYHNGNNSEITHNNTGSLLFKTYVNDMQFINYATDKDIIFKSDDGSGGTTEYFRVDGSSVRTLFSRNTQHVDNSKAIFGNGDDLQIYHSGSHSIIQDIGTGDLLLRGNNLRLQNSDGTETFLHGYDNGQVELFYNSAKRLETTSNGVLVSGFIESKKADTGAGYNDGIARFVNETTATSGGSAVINVRNSYGIGFGGLIKFWSTSTATSIGNISFNSSRTAVNYNTGSDYRLKEDYRDFNGLDLTSKIKVYDFKWKNQDDRSYGVIAHELDQVIPGAVTGEKDAEDMQCVDYSKLVPLLIKSVQELKDENLELKARVSALENN